MGNEINMEKKERRKYGKEKNNTGERRKDKKIK